MRFVFNVGIKVIGLVLLIIMLLKQSRYIPYLIVVIGAFFTMYRPTLQAAKRTRGESGNPAEVVACHGGYPKARTKLERSHLVTDEGSTLDTAFKLSDGYDGTMIRIACCWPIIEKSPLVR